MAVEAVEAVPAVLAVATVHRMPSTPLTQLPTPTTLTFPPQLPDSQVAGRYRQPWQGVGEFSLRLILEDLDALPSGELPTVLDIGCGGGLMDVPLWQHQLASCVGRYVGIEPDPASVPAPVFTEVFNQTFETAPLESASIDLAYAAMVMEHVADPRAFFAQLARVLRPGGVFWGFTVDRRHYFSWASQLVGTLRIKDRYLDRVKGTKGESAARYDNYPTHYRCNSPRKLQQLAGEHFSVQCWSLHRVGQLDGYMPYKLRRVSRLADRVIIKTGLPGSVLFTRMVRRA
jgi:SAM-dependent methyltransferase